MSRTSPALTAAATMIVVKLVFDVAPFSRKMVREGKDV